MNVIASMVINQEGRSQQYGISLVAGSRTNSGFWETSPKSTGNPLSLASSL